MLAECIDVVRGLAPALGVVGLINVQLALHEGRLFVLEANPRASRTVPFASKAIGVNLVEAACKLVAGAPLSVLDASRGQTPGHVCVKAAVFPFARFPGADAVLGPEMRSTGEVMATAADFPTAFAKAERAAGRPLPDGRHGLPLRARRRQARRGRARPQPRRRSASGSAPPAGRPGRSPPPGSRSTASAR